MAATVKEIQALLDKYEGVISKGFIEAVNALRDVTTLKKVAEALEEGDVRAAYKAVRLGSWTPLTESVRQAYLAGGISMARGFIFDINNPRAAKWMAERSSTMIVQLSEERKQAVREVMKFKLEKGMNGRQKALLLMGRWDAERGRRVGGIIGLHSKAAGYVLNAIAELTDPKKMRHYLTRERRDRRFDRTVMNALKAEKPVAMADVHRMTVRYADRLLRLRAETIGRTESTAAFNAGREESLQQAVDEGLVKKSQIVRIWDATLDKRTRTTHAIANGQKRGLKEPFRVGGSSLMYPGAPGGPARETVNCILPDTRVSVSGLRSAIRGHYSGEVINVSATGKVDFTVTADHKILTNRGWVSAHSLYEGDEVVDCGFGDLFSSAVTKPEISNAVTSAQELYSSASSLGCVSRSSGVIVDFDGNTVSENVDIVSIDSNLRCAFDSAPAQSFDYLTLADTDINSGGLTAKGVILISCFRQPLPGNSSMRRFGSLFSIFRRMKRGGSSVALGHIRAVKAKVLYTGVNSPSTRPNFFSNLKDWPTLMIKAVNRVKVRLSLFSVFLRSLIASSSTHLGLINRKIKILHTRKNGRSGYARLFFYLSYRCRTLMGFLNSAVMLFSNLPLPVKVGLAFTQANPHSTHDRVDLISFYPESGRRGCDCLSRSNRLSNTGKNTAKVVTIQSIRRFHYKGPVYDFETSNGIIITGNTVSHNCRCFLRTEANW